ncbi:MAG: hypothetical protein L6R36_005750 [Xanthoria steineri]|nr:MAG: hypothetical protein L6R36_005750 [Xanthoria steineri]
MMDHAIADAERFLAPITSKASRPGQTKSLIDCLSSETSGNAPSRDQYGHGLLQRQTIIEKALSLLSSLDDALCKSPHSLDQPFARQRAQKATDALLDLVVIEGIYPCLSNGVGMPMERRVKSALKKDLITRPLSQDENGSHNQELIAAIVDCLYPILSSGKVLASNVEARVFIDMVAAVGQVAFNPDFAVGSRQKHLEIFDKLLERPAIDVLPTLTSLLHPGCPDWLRSPISNRLSLLPLRPDVVRQILNFMAASTPGDTQRATEAQDGRPTGPNLTLDALARASKLLTSVPSTMTADNYFSALAPQLLDLLDDQNIDNKRIASYIIGNGILGKRKIGSPGTIGWRLFAEPILESIQPPVDNYPVPEKALKMAIDRLSALVQFHPNPGLTKRLVIPVLLPLWGLQCYAINNARANWADQIHRIFVVYMKMSVTESQLLLLSDHLMWDGPPMWTFGPGGQGGIEIRQREGSNNYPENMDRLIESIDSRVEQYSKLLQAAVLTDEQLSTVFTHACKRWLHRSPASLEYDRLDIMDSDPKIPLEPLVNAKLAQRLLEEFKDQITSSLSGIFQLVEPILSVFVTEDRQKTDREIRATGLRFKLESIASGEKENDVEDESVGTVSTALSLLSAILAPSENSILSDESVLQSIQRSLEYIAQESSSLDSSITMSASNILMLLQLRSDISEHLSASKTPKAIDAHADDRKKHRTALTHLADELAPVRAQGLSTIVALVSKSSPVLNIHSTSVLLISLLQDQDEYIYLSAIRALGDLASNHPKTVVRLLLEQYSDRPENVTLDVRIRIGEALNKTIEHLGQLFVDSVANEVSEGMIAIASRRGDRPKTLRKRDRAKRKEAKAKEEAEEAWEGEIPEETTGNDEEGTIHEHIAKVLEGWADTGREEDIRIRTSALSILGTAIETNIAGVGATVTSTAIDCVLVILKLEKSNDRAILRRAAVMVIMSLVKAFDTADEQGLQLGFGFAGENLAEVITVLKYVEITDTDDMVVGHVRVVSESLQAWQRKSIIGHLGSRGPREANFSLDENGIVGLAFRPKTRPKIEEVD